MTSPITLLSKQALRMFVHQPTPTLLVFFFLNLPAQGEYSQCIAECSVAYKTCCKTNVCTDLNLGTCGANKKKCIKACSFANDKITTEAIADVDNDNQGAGLRGHYLINSVMGEDAVITNDNPIKPVLDDTFIMSPSSFAVALNEETFVANGTFADYLVINPSVMMKMNDV